MAKHGTNASTQFSGALAATFPVFLGYSTIGIAFGLLLVKAGLPWWLSPVMSIFVYAGAAQFMGISLLVNGIGTSEIAVLTFLINARHMAYGLSLLGTFTPFKSSKPYLIFSLTDETFGIVSTTKPPEGSDPETWYALIAGLDQFYWVFASTLGALIGFLIPDAWTRGLDFALTALFVVLLMEQILAMRHWAPYAIAVGGAIVAWTILGPGRYFLLAATVVSVAALFAFRRRLERA